MIFVSNYLAPGVPSRVVCVRTTSCEVQEGDKEGKTGTRNDNNGGGVGKKGKIWFTSFQESLVLQKRYCDHQKYLTFASPQKKHFFQSFFQLSMVGVILINYILCVLPAIVVQELHTRGRGFEWVGVTFNMVCRFWMVTKKLNLWIYIHIMTQSNKTQNNTLLSHILINISFHCIPF